MRATFPKAERLKSRKLIEAVFEGGKTFKSGPLRLRVLENKVSDHHQAAFAVPKRNFRLAVQRNKIKRQLREAYRLHKHLLSKNSGRKFAMVFLYISKEVPDYALLEKNVSGLLKQLTDEME